MLEMNVQLPTEQLIQILFNSNNNLSDQVKTACNRVDALQARVSSLESMYQQLLLASQNISIPESTPRTSQSTVPHDQTHNVSAETNDFQEIQLTSQALQSAVSSWVQENTEPDDNGLLSYS